MAWKESGPSGTDTPGAASRPKPPTFWQTVFSVLASFFGVQSRENRIRDFTSGNPLLFITVGIVLTVLFVLALWFGVQLLLHQVGAPN